MGARIAPEHCWTRKLLLSRLVPPNMTYLDFRSSVLSFVAVGLALGHLPLVADDAAGAQAEAALADTISVPVGRTQAEVHEAVLAALQHHHWQVGEKSEGQVIGTIVRRPITMTVTVKYDAKTIELWYSGTGPSEIVARKGPGWMNNLSQMIARSLGGGVVSPRTFHEVQLEGTDRAVVYVYREKSFVGAAVKWGVWLDGQPAANLRQNEYVALKITPGQHLVLVGGRDVAEPLEIVSVVSDPVTGRVTTTYKVRSDRPVPAIIKENTFMAERGGTYFVRAQGLSQKLVTREQAMREIVGMVERPSELRQ
jgi:hypothetical protein